MSNLTNGNKRGPNKIGAGVKANVIGVFDKIGGREQMCAWAKENLTEFYRLYAKLIPAESTVDINFRDANELSRDELMLIAASGRAGAVEAGNSSTEPSELH